MDDIMATERAQALADSVALNGLSAYIRFQATLPDTLSLDERQEALQHWAETAGAVILEHIDEYDGNVSLEDVFRGTNGGDSLQRFIIAVAMLSLIELKRVVPPRALAYTMSEVIPPDVMSSALRRAVNGHF